ncbi:MAG: FAD-binding oxidoreductase [Anaerolineales bacterium]|nr:FAD-binding oxidoreductase [Anaerolineales bacterium]
MAEQAENAQKRVDACEAVVVGAGIVGAWVAHRLAQNGMETAILEAQSVAGGASGRSAGLVLTGLPGHYGQAVAAYGRAKAREVWTLIAEGRERLLDEADALGVSVTRTGSLITASDEAEAEMLGEAARLLREDGFDAWFGYVDPLDLGFRATLRSPGDAILDVAAFTRALVAASGATVHEHTEVDGIQLEDDGVRVWAQGRTILARMVILAIDGYAPLFAPYFAERIVSARNVVLISAPVEETVFERPYCSAGGRIYGYQLPDQRVVLGTWPPLDGSEIEQDPDWLAEEELRQFAGRHLPDVDWQHAERRSGSGGFTRDGLPIVGRLPERPSVGFAVGMGGRGLSLSPVVADRVVDLMLHDADPGPLSAERLA